jgi:hypothetical protein
LIFFQFHILFILADGQMEDPDPTLEALVEATRQEAASGDAAVAFRLEVWQQTLVRIRRIEAAMKQTTRPPSSEDS